MTEQAQNGENWRDVVLSNPDKILEDRDLMRALIEANERQMGSNVVDMRGLAMEKLESRLDRLEDTHRSVIAAAYENLAGTNQIHRAVLKALDQNGFEALVISLGTEIADILRVDSCRLVFESKQAEQHRSEALTPKQLAPTLMMVKPGEIDAYVRGTRPHPHRIVTLRQVANATQKEINLFGEKAEWLRSEALVRLDLGVGRLPAMLALGSEDPHQFRASQGGDLLTFLGATLERLLQKQLG